MKKFFLLLCALLGGATASSQDCPPVNVILMVDQSGSITVPEMEQIVEVLDSAISGWEDHFRSGGFRVAISTFDHGVSRRVGLTTYSSDLLDTLKVLQSVLGAGTDLRNALLDPAAHYRSQIEQWYVASGVNIVIVLTDGIQSVGSVSPAEIQSLRRSLAAEGPGARLLYFAIDVSRSYDPYKYPNGREHNVSVLLALDQRGEYRDLWNPADITAMLGAIRGVVGCGQ